MITHDRRPMPCGIKWPQVTAVILDCLDKCRLKPLDATFVRLWLSSAEAAGTCSLTKVASASAEAEADKSSAEAVGSVRACLRRKCHYSREVVSEQKRR